jgi:Sulfotransferase domain
MDRPIKRLSLLPDFLVIGAMKSATTTLHEQLARQPGLFMSRLKEPNFFSDDELYARGLDWYTAIFRDAKDHQLRGESSTHYTKLPTYPSTALRMVRVLPRVKLVYVMRHPIDRLASHYLHELSVGRIKVGLERALVQHPELVDYGRYSMQLEPYLESFGPDAVHPIFFDRLIAQPDRELASIGRFLGAAEPLVWDHTLKHQNVGRERLRASTLRNTLVQAPVLGTLRRALIPGALNERVKSYWRMGVDPPQIPPALESQLRDIYDADLDRLGSWLGIPLDCESFRSVNERESLEWSQDAKEFHAKMRRGRKDGQGNQEYRSSFWS